MNNVDVSDKERYSKLGFRAGLEIHQQLDTSKLFCRCSSILTNGEPDFSVKRKLHKVAGESGKVDSAVEYEHSLNKSFLYQYSKEGNCLVELDEEPPKSMNQEALDIGLQIALLLNCEIYQNAQIMRKTVIDGSNTSGFQRTVLIAHSGYIETSFGKVPIASVCLEEDSARPSESEEKDDNTKILKLDRLGIPLIEIASGVVEVVPEQIKEAALKIGEILRACKVKRGIGTIRQDVNVSVRGHERVEIKGFQDPSMMVKTINIEIARQLKNVEEGKIKGEVRGALPNGESKFNRPMPGSARMYPETDLPLLKISRERINSLKKNLPKLKNEIKKSLEKKGLSGELLNLVLDGNVEEFEELLKVHNNSELVAKSITLWRTEFASKMKKSYEEVKEILNELVIIKVLEAVEQNKINEGDVKSVLGKILSGEGIEHALKIEKVDYDVLDSEIKKIVYEKPGLREGAYMGLIISKLGKDVDKRRAMETLKKLIST
jgi:Glu-tRNA(Gln) amidotransferase subunit E-like FAD-binding protein